MSDEEATLVANTSTLKSLYLTASGMDVNLGDLRRIVAAAENLSDKAHVKVSKLWGEGDDRYFKRIEITESTLLASGRIADVQVVR